MSEDQKKKLKADFSRTASRVDPIEGTLIREERVREHMIQEAMTKILEKKMKACYKREGANHFVNCEKYARAYYERIARPELKANPSHPGPVEMSDIE